MIEDYNLPENKEKIVLNRLKEYMGNRGIRKNDVADALGWPPSKVTKIFSGKQKLLYIDLEKLSSAMGVPLEAFLGEAYDLEEYEQENGPMPLDGILEMYEESYPCEDVIDEMMVMEIPFTCRKVLNLNMRSFAFYSATNMCCGNPLEDEKPQYKPKSVIRTQGIRSRLDDFLEMGYYFAGGERVALAISYTPDRRKTTGGDSKRTRAFYKDFISEIETESFDKVKGAGEEFDSEFARGEICSIVYDLKNLPPKEKLEADLKKMFDVYVLLIENASDAISNFFWENRLNSKSILEVNEVLNKYNDVKKLIVSDLVGRGNSISRYKVIEDPNASRLVKTAGQSGIILSVSGCETAYWKFRIVGMQGVSISFDSEEGRQPDYKAEAELLLSRLAEVFLEDIWYPDKLQMCKLSFVFRDEGYYNAFNGLIKDKKFNNWFSNILINENNRCVAEEYIYERADGQKKKSPLDYPLLYEDDENGINEE